MSETVNRIGIVGGGQLGRMLTEAAKLLDFEIMVLDPTPNCPAAQVGARQIRAELHDTDAVTYLAMQCNLVTWEIEHIPAQHLAVLAEQGHAIEPSPSTLLKIQDKFEQHSFLHGRGIPVAPFSAELDNGRFEGKGPFMVKARKGGFDGRGNLKVESLDDPLIKQRFGDEPVYAEQVLEFEKELSVVAARDRDGNIATYPVVETVHEDNICHTVLSPAQIDPKITGEANEIAKDTLAPLKGAGVFAIEMFLLKSGKVVVNEIAPRVHNSGHLTIEASETSQFQQHIRAITGLPLGNTGLIYPAAAMINILGTREGPIDGTSLEKVLAMRGVYAHLYGKRSRPGRKVGHITAVGEDAEVVMKRVRLARLAFTGA